MNFLIKNPEKSRKLVRNMERAIFSKNRQLDIADFIMRLPSAGNRKVYTLDQLKDDLHLCNNYSDQYKI